MCSSSHGWGGGEDDVDALEAGTVSLTVVILLVRSGGPTIVGQAVSGAARYTKSSSTHRGC